MEYNTIETVITPDVPKILENEQTTVYVPTASTTIAGIASFYTDHFEVSVTGVVKNKSAAQVVINKAAIKVNEEDIADLEDSLGTKSIGANAWDEIRQNSTDVSTIQNQIVSHADKIVENADNIDAIESDIDDIESDLVDNYSTKTNVINKISEHDDLSTAHLLLRQQIEALEAEIARLDGRGESYGEIDKTQTELLAMSSSERDQYIFTYLDGKYTDFVLAQGQLIYTLESDTENTHEWEYNETTSTWADNGAYTIEKASNTNYGIVKGGNEYTNIVSGLLEIIKSDYATHIGTSEANFDYDGVNAILTSLISLEQHITNLIAIGTLQDMQILFTDDAATIDNQDSFNISLLTPYDWAMFKINITADNYSTYNIIKPSEFVDGSKVEFYTKHDKYETILARVGDIIYFYVFDITGSTPVQVTTDVATFQAWGIRGIESDGISADEVSYGSGTVEDELIKLDAKANQAEIDVIKTKQEVSDLQDTVNQLNPNGEDRISQEGYGTQTLPVNAIGTMQTKLTGNRLTNWYINSGFITISDWYTVNASYVVNDGIATVTGVSGTNVNIALAQYHNVTIGDKFYINVKMRALGTVDKFCYSINTVRTTIAESPVVNTWYNIGKIVEVDATGNIPFSILSVSVTAAESEGKQIEMTKPILVNLSDCGLESLTAAQCDAMTELYFEGTANSMVGRARAVSEDETEETVQYIKPTLMNRLPDGTSDTIDSDGVLTKKVKKHVLTADDITSVYTGYDDAEVIDVAKPIDYASYGVAEAKTNCTIDGYRTVADVSLSAGLTSATWSELVFGVSMAKGTTLAMAKTALAGLTLTYALNTSNYEKTYNMVSGNLLAKPKGTVYFDNVIADANVYDSGFTILNTDFPIESVESAYKLNDDLSQTEIDVSTITIDASKERFTSTAMTDDDIIIIDYIPDIDTVGGLNTLSYLNSTNLIPDESTGKYYKETKTITVVNNVPTATSTYTEVS